MTRRRLEVRVEGIVQGVGFRPFVHGLATRLGLVGMVSNDGRGVVLEVEGVADDVRAFLGGLEREAPPLAVVERVVLRDVPLRGGDGFEIGTSVAGSRSTLVSADVAVCGDCLREMRDPGDRRYRYPFINCTNCGPRYTIVRDVPYDRATTTMASFVLCADCRREYEDPTDRRFHAQPVACPACGPHARLAPPRPNSVAAFDLGDPIRSAADLLREGRILAVKGLGGYHLAADACSEAAVSRLRSRKHREEKPFALMVADVAAARALVAVDEAEEALLVSPRRPIVLLRRLSEEGVAASVAPGNRFLGLMLPYTPLHHLILDAFGGPLVMTSGNVSDEPIAYVDEDAFARLGAIADAFLVHDRPIHVRVDDSVARAFAGSPMLLRRSRGYAPAPVRFPFGRGVLACGGELKNTVCVTRGEHAFLSQHIGDLENYDAYRSFEETARHLMRLFDVRPEVVAHDLHPEYLSTKWALAQDAERVAVQHHYAHVASCMVDNGTEDPVIGVAFDGLGLGTDGTIWGGEILVADLHGFTRIGHLACVPMPGGEAAIRQPWRMAAMHATRALGNDASLLAVARRNEAQWPTVLRMARQGVNAPLTSSVGRLFDAVAALLGIRDAVTYEGQAAIELEQAADVTEAGAYEARLVSHTTRLETAGRGPRSDGEGFLIEGSDLFAGAAGDLARGFDITVISARFHNGLARTVLAACRAARDRTGLATVALTGGVFQNLLLLERTTSLLSGAGFTVLRHVQVPCNDGGLSLGQAAIASRALRRD